MKSILASCLLLVLSLYGMGQRVCRLNIETGSEGMLMFYELGVWPVHGFLKKDGVFTGEFEYADYVSIRDAGIPCEVLIADTESWYLQREHNPSKDPVFNSCFNQVQNYPIPNGFSLGSMAGYYTLDEAYAALEQMRAWYPNLITEKVIIGNSIEDRPIYSYIISDNPGVNEGEPQVLYTSIHHSSEPCSLQQLIFFMFHILQNYGSDPEITYLIDNTELHFVPVVNPDGYVYNQTSNPNGGGNWRKNRRVVTPFIGNTGIGIDLNRNYSFAWGYDNIGSQPLVASPWYRGTAAFSEPESAAMRQYLMAHNFLLQINWHAYGNMLIYPWSYINQSTPDSLLFLKVCNKMTEDNHYRYGNVGETYGYQSNGDADDYSYGNQDEKPKILSMTGEIGTMDDGFWPAPAKIIDLCRGAVRMNLNMAHFANAFHEFDDVSPDIIGFDNGELPFTLQCIGLDVPANFTVTFTPLTNNISFGTSNFIFEAMSLLETREAAVPYFCWAAYGDEVAWVVSVNNGLFTFNDTVYKFRGPATVLFYDDCETMNNWSGSSAWGVSNEVFYAGNASITESPDGNYSLFMNDYLELNQEIDLSNYGYAFLSMKMRYAIENTHDYCQIQVSNDGGSSWYPLCTKHSRVGSDDQDEGQPVYTGIVSDWLTDKASLNNYLGQTIKIRFHFWSDQSNNLDGFYFDEFYVIGFDNAMLANAMPVADAISLYPNPSTGHISIDAHETGKIIISDMSGRLMYEALLENGTHRIDVGEWARGMYFCRFLGTKLLTEKILKL